MWTCLALLLTGPVYGMDAQAVGLLALVGGATMLCTPLAGSLVDRHGPDPVNSSACSRSSSQPRSWLPAPGATYPG